MWRVITTGFVLVTLTVGLGIPLLFVNLFDRKGIIEGYIARFWSKAILFAAGIKVNVQGLELLERDRSYLFMGNHESALDIPVVVGYIPFQLRILAKKELYRIPLFGWLLWQGGHIRIDRSNREQAIKSMDEGTQRVLSRGHSIVVFPEGTRSRDGQMRPFKKGGFMLAIKHNIPIVPLTLIGARELLPRKSLAIKSGVIKLIVGNPILVDEYTVERRDELIERVWNEIFQTRERYRQSSVT